MKNVICHSVQLFFALIVVSPLAADNWPEAMGPNHNWKVAGEAPVKWSAVRNENIKWRAPLPEAGMSGVVIWGDRVFTTIHVPLKSVEEKVKAKDVIGYCLDANTGKVLWTVDLPGSAEIQIAGGFTDGTTYAPITDGQHVWFFNRLGSIGCFDMDGSKVWLREMPVRFRHSNRQHQPILTGDWLLHVEVADKKYAKPKKSKYPKEDVAKKEFWTYVHALDKRTGKIVWREKTGTGIHNTPMIGKLPDGKLAVVHGRGGGHGPAEKPYGLSLSLIDGDEPGKTLWSTGLKGFGSQMNCQWREDGVFAFTKSEHLVLDPMSGEVLKTQPITKGHSVWSNQNGKWSEKLDAEVKLGKGITYHSNMLVGDWHYFRCHGAFYLGRVNVKSGRVEYLQLPAQITADKTSRDNDQWLWQSGKGNKNNPTNASGFSISFKNGTGGTGWGHVSAASPLVVGQYMYIPVATGTVYVIDTNAEVLSPDALVAINDLGLSKETWTLSPLSYANGRIYAHTMREVICIEAK